MGFICRNIGKDNYSQELTLVEDKAALITLINNLMTIPGIDRDWLQRLSHASRT